MREPRFTYFAACPPGVEGVLLDEVRAARLSRAEGQVGGVRFQGVEADGWRAVLHLRTAVRVFRELARFPAGTSEELYRGTRGVDWSRILHPGQTFAVDARVSHSAHTHSGFVALRVKDAVADWFRERSGARPSVDARHPDVRLRAHVHRDRCTLALDLAGRSLHRRGYRTAAGEAPLGECLAAAAVALSGWDRVSPFLDPLCGSGTILIEAGMLAAGIAPGLLAEEYAFERWPGFDRARWEEMRAEARRSIRIPRRLRIRGGDADPEVVSAARENAAAAGLEDLVEVEEADLEDFRPTPGWGATLISNPPYGVRLGEEDRLVRLYERLGEILRERCRGFHVHLFLASGRLAKALRLKPERYWPLVNGGLRVRLTRYEIH